MKLFKELVIFILFSLVFGFVFNHFSAEGVDPFSSFDAGIDVSKDLRAMKDFDAVLGHFENRTALFIDTRDREDYLAGHIPGALNAPYYYMELSYSMVSEEILNYNTIILYGTDQDDIAPVRTADYYQVLTDRELKILYGGIKTWNDAGLPLEKGAADE